jgi:hypothetical protein
MQERRILTTRLITLVSVITALDIVLTALHWSPTVRLEVLS